MQRNLAVCLCLSNLPTLFLSPVHFVPAVGAAVKSGPDVEVMSGGAIINIRSCRETKRPKWKGLAGWGDLTMSCTSVIFLVRLELSQGFNWNPDFKETLHPSTPPPPTPDQLHPCTNSPGWNHSCPQTIPYTQTVTTTISERASPCTALAGIDFAHFRSRCLGWLASVWNCDCILGFMTPTLWSNQWTNHHKPMKEPNIGCGV